MLDKVDKHQGKLTVTARSNRLFKNSLRTYGLPISLGLVSIIVLLAIAPVILNMINKGNDYPAHLFSAEVWAKYGYPDRPRPQFLFHALVIFIYRLVPGVSVGYAGLLLALIYYVALAIIVCVLVYSALKGASLFLKLVCAVFLTLTLTLIGPINLLTYSAPNLYFGYIPPHAYHNPTVALLKPFALILFLYAVRVFTNFRKSYISIFLCALVSALGTMAKPSYAIVIIPVLGLLTLIRWGRKQPINWLLLLAGIALPIAIVLIWQQNYYHDSSMGSFIFAPFTVMSLYSPDGNLLLKFILSIAFPLAVLGFYYRDVLKDISMQIAWLGFLVGVFYTYFLTESVTWSDGNFTWSGQIAIFILFVASTLFFIKENMPLLSQRRFTPAFLVSSLLLILHLIGGILLYWASLKPDWLHWM